MKRIVHKVRNPFDSKTGFETTSPFTRQNKHNSLWSTNDKWCQYWKIGWKLNILVELSKIMYLNPVCNSSPMQSGTNVKLCSLDSNRLTKNEHLYYISHLSNEALLVIQISEYDVLLTVLHHTTSATRYQGRPWSISAYCRPSII